jgi:hypothetical protein
MSIARPDKDVGIEVTAGHATLPTQLQVLPDVAHGSAHGPWKMLSTEVTTAASASWEAMHDDWQSGVLQNA